MSKNVAGASYYAEALYEVACEQNYASGVLYELKAMSKVADKEIGKIFQLAIISREQKKDLIQELDVLGFSQMVLNFIKILIEHDQLTKFPAILQEYVNLYENSNEIKIVHATFAKRPSSEVEDEIIKELEEKFNKFVVLLIEENPYLLGGVKFKYDGKVIDNTVRKQLNEFLRKL
ncbi:MAG: ATP synthase F1 subunit delta [Mycoplasmatales bacterium]